MAILTLGSSLTDEVDAFLHLTELVDPGLPAGATIKRIVGAAEAYVKRETQRAFEAVTHVKEPYDIEPGAYELLLSDMPVTSVTTIEEVTARHDDSTITTTVIPASYYVVDKAAGMITLLDGSWFLPGPQAVLVTWASGYTPDEIKNNAHPEIHVLKQLLLSIIQNWFKKNKDEIGHVQTISMGPEAITVNFGLTSDEKDMMNQLRRW